MTNRELHPAVKRDFERMTEEEEERYIEAAQELLLDDERKNEH